MASKVHSGSGTAIETPKTVIDDEIRATDAIETERAVEAAKEKEVEHHPTVGVKMKETLEKEAKSVADHLTEVAGAAETTIPYKKLPVDSVIRIIVPVHKVESIFGRNGDFIKKICEETKANIRVLEGPDYDPKCIVEISSKEDMEAPLSSAMDGVIRLFKCVNGFPENESDGVASIPFCSSRLLLTSMQATSLIGNRGSSVNTIQDNIGCSVRILPSDEVSTLSANSDDRIVELKGEALKVRQALEAVHRHLHMFSVDHSIPPLFDSNMVEVAMKMAAEEPVIWTGSSRAISGAGRAFYRLDRDFFGPALMPTFYPMYVPPPPHHCRRRCRCRRRPILPPPSGMESMNGPKRTRYLWKDDIVNTFLDACIHEITNNGRENGSLKAVSWKKVGEMLKDRHNFPVDTKQMKNYFDGLKTKYRAWLSLKNKTDNKYDPSTNMFNLTDIEWETEIKKNKCIEELRDSPLRFPDLCAQLFDGGVDQALTKPGLSLPTLSPSHVTTTPSENYIVFSCSVEASLEPQAADALIPPSTQTLPPLPATETPAEPQKEPMVEVPPEMPQVQPASEVVVIETKRPMSVFEEEMLGVLKMIAEKMNKPEPPSKPTFEDCEKKLNELGWPKDDPLQLVALTIFCDENDNYRECWMKLDPDVCANWVRMIGRSKRFS
ncbi:unnamed protein product [Lactuca saligna]|uniref:K Homology domain-containing protein n=1 Tax=Lactuca saligna TaxID=75948 RepID=A0AA36EF12_LACSI|nr:unnamed protein product [Lactuca saligna]